MKDGDAWRRLVRNLVLWAEDHHFPATVSKGFGVVARFTRLLEALQQLMPKELRRHSHSPEALATAMSRALSM